MKIHVRVRALAALAVLVSASQALAQTVPSPPEGPTTAVLATLTVNPGADRSRLRDILPEEVRATVRLYLDGKVAQWYSRGDGKGVVFLLNCGSLEEAKALTDELPLSKAELVTFELMALRPLGPLSLLLEDPASAPPSGGQR